MKRWACSCESGCECGARFDLKWDASVFVRKKHDGSTLLTIRLAFVIKQYYIYSILFLYLLEKPILYHLYIAGVCRLYVMQGQACCCC